MTPEIERRAESAVVFLIGLVIVFALALGAAIGALAVAPDGPRAPACVVPAEAPPPAPRVRCIETSGSHFSGPHGRACIDAEGRLQMMAWHETEAGVVSESASEGP